MTKQALREAMRARLDSQPEADRLEKSRRVEQKLFAMPVFCRARCVAFFASMGGEVDTHPMIRRALREGKRVALPRVEGRRELVFCEVRELAADTAPGTLGILEPKADCPRLDPGAIDFVVVPGLAFDGSGGRLGRGAGYYDRFLARLTPAAAKVGIGFSFQRVERVPLEAHDEKLDEVVTD